MSDFLKFWWDCAQEGFSIGSGAFGIIEGLGVFVVAIAVICQWKLEDPRWKKWGGRAMSWAGIVSLALFVFGTFIYAPYSKWKTALSNSRLEEAAATRTRDLQLAYDKLSGAKGAIRLLLIARRNAQIHCHYYATRFETSKEPEDRKNSEYQAAEADKISTQIGQAYEGIHTPVATIRRTNQGNKEAMALTEKINHAPDLVELYPNASGLRDDDLETWKNRIYHGRIGFVDERFTRPIDRLLDIMLDELKPRESK